MLRKVLTLIVAVVVARPAAVLVASADEVRGRGSLTAQGDGVAILRGRGTVDLSGNGMLWIKDAAPPAQQNEGMGCTAAPGCRTRLSAVNHSALPGWGFNTGGASILIASANGTESRMTPAAPQHSHS